MGHVRKGRLLDKPLGEEYFLTNYPEVRLKRLAAGIVLQAMVDMREKLLTKEQIAELENKSIKPKLKNRPPCPVKGLKFGLGFKMRLKCPICGLRRCDQTPECGPKLGLMCELETCEHAKGCEMEKNAIRSRNVASGRLTLNKRQINEKISAERFLMAPPGRHRIKDFCCEILDINHDALTARTKRTEGARI